MSEPKNPAPVKIIASMVFSDVSECTRAREAMSEKMGREDYVSRDLPFDRTRYYEKEMGSGLRRIFVSYEGLEDRGNLVEVKLTARRVETAFSIGGRRRVNIDPGYVSLENLVLLTFKGYSHRIYLGRGVYAEVTLIYENGGFSPLRWTYPDYASPEVKEIMNNIRERYRVQLKEGQTV